VYCTGRSVAGSPGMKNRPKTIHETAKIVTARGGSIERIRRGDACVIHAPATSPF